MGNKQHIEEHAYRSTVENALEDYHEQPEHYLDYIHEPSRPQPIQYQALNYSGQTHGANIQHQSQELPNHNEGQFIDNDRHAFQQQWDQRQFEVPTYGSNANYDDGYNREQNNNFTHQAKYEDDYKSEHFVFDSTSKSYELADEGTGSIIEANGEDNYNISTYYDDNDQMIDPYYDSGQRYYPNYNNNYPYIIRDNFDEENDLSNSIINGYLKNYDDEEGMDDMNTLDKLRFDTDDHTISDVSSAETRVSAKASPKINKAVGISRASTVLRKFKLWNGNFIFDSPISKYLLEKYSIAATENQNLLSNEFKFMRYQAITCEPDKLAEQNFTVRQLKYFKGRETELMIVITMYNEDHILLGRTLKGVMENIKRMVRKKNSNTWGPDAWKKIVVCIVSDGRSKINEKALSLLSSLGCYQDGFAKDEVNDKKVKMHAYEHTTMMNITEVSEKDIKLECNQNTVPVQLLFCLKEQNQKKINSHRWAFEGFAELLQPNVVTLLDAGTMPGPDSIYQLWREFRNPQVGGACGEIKTDIGRFGKNLLNPLVASQNFEYKMSNILDKTTESNFGFISVLPGAFSAYRFYAVKGQPLEKYFHGEHMEGDQKNFHFFSSNMYLAEDRILCFEIVTKKNSNWILKYCKESYASTDVPSRVPEFILQRRRWLNGSFFASIYSFCHFYKIWSSGHSIFRKLILNFEFFYLFFNTLMSWFSLSSFFLVFRILTVSLSLQYQSVFNILSVVFLWLYGICILSTFILSLGNKPRSTEIFYVTTFVIFAVLMGYMIFCTVFLTVKAFESILLDHSFTVKSLLTSDTFRDIVISIGSTYALYLISSIIYLQPWHMVTSFAQYILLSPSYINVLNIYAFCNVHDLSWGTKGAVAKPLGKINTQADGTFDMEILISSEEIQLNYEKHFENLNKPTANEEVEETINYEERKTGYYGNIRSIIIIVWIMTNFAVVAAVLETGGIDQYISMRHNKKSNEITEKLLPIQSSYYFNIILWIVAFLALVRFFGCSLYLISRPFKKLWFKRTARNSPPASSV
ncbi:hypothetical protein Kpol_1054p24 [Vanderwaltozyma polyspora DSM 70294]|uniref:chitin synthase n=1 Tax=Vanderwaltozyma polyspora (strain ATCC 22028 / DSM 70294 / BCRC 21397 / CBS 2163 / NBRC 10782 / NRRL Y-8283 / UCD 57-17) TaxID=436907 RepID=A7TIB1_VANPO|nr:uncharacterized protein Kpol_1054p24 [Vanderwaltozyma polyspora DSM 70294]EDO17977.1 hypothetical protein Kpol_1054p24 [Vanderwaltozyma polyspora DSM 70294]